MKTHGHIVTEHRYKHIQKYSFNIK